MIILVPPVLSTLVYDINISEQRWSLHLTLRHNQIINKRIIQRLGVERDVQSQKGCNYDANHQSEIPKKLISGMERKVYYISGT